MICLIVSTAIGYLSALLGRFLDSLLDYGSLLGFIRFRIAQYYADDKLGSELYQATEIDDFAERMSEINDLYWRIAAKRFWFTGWVCLKCFSARVCMISYFIASLVMLKYDVDTLCIFVFALNALAFCFNEIQRDS